MFTTTIPFAKLVLSDTNVRKSNGEHGKAALAASIAEHGLLQPLIVTPATPKKTKYAIHAGGRRWRAIGLLIEQGVLPKDHAVEVRVCETQDAAAREISLAENLLREAMTPADECTAYQAIIAEGASDEDVARRFGVTVRHVQGRLRLADLAAPIFAALAAGDITLDVAMAYGSTADRDRQQTAWERFSTNWQGDNPQAIRRALAEDTLSGTHPVALFVGEADYTAAGGRIERDLFAAQGEGVWLDATLAQELATKKMTFEAEVAVLGTKLGWVKPLLTTHVQRSETEQLDGYWPQSAPLSDEAQARVDDIGVRLEELQEVIETEDDEDSPELAAAVAEAETLNAEYDRLTCSEPVIPDADRPNVGTFLILDQSGKPVLANHYYTTAQSRRGGSGHSSTSGTNDGAEPVVDTDSDAGANALPRALEEQLAKDRRDILALHVAMDPALALDLAIFSIARDLAGHFGYRDTGCAIRITDRCDPAGIKDIPEVTAGIELAAIQASLPADWAKEDDTFTAFLAFRALDEETRASWLAFAVSQSLKASLASGQHSNAFQSQLGAMIGIYTAQHWRPGAERFFDRLKKSSILSILGSIDPAMPGRYAMAKKGELASAATRLCAGDTIVEPAIRERALRWIPDEMSFTAAERGADIEVEGEGVPLSSADDDLSACENGEDAAGIDEGDTDTDTDDDPDTVLSSDYHLAAAA